MDLNLIYKPAPFLSEICVSLDYFKDHLAHDNADFSPPYQRGNAWTVGQQEAFMAHLLSGGDVLPLIFQREPDKGNAEILDGKQRATAILAWLDNEIPARFEDGRVLWARDVTRGLKRVDIKIKYINLPFEERKRFYVRFNSAGTPHTPEQLQAALLAQPREK